jgi:hypothetical protein
MRRVLVPVHLISAVGLLGADLALAGLGITGATETALAVQVYPAMSIVATWIMLPLGGLAIVSGLTLAWTQNAKFRPDWVRVKLLITLTLAVALVAVVAPGLADEAVRARAGATGGNPAFAVGPRSPPHSWWSMSCSEVPSRHACSIVADKRSRVGRGAWRERAVEDPVPLASRARLHAWLQSRCAAAVLRRCPATGRNTGFIGDL